MPGDLIKAIARRMLNLRVLRFVDDYFAAGSAETADHAMWVFARYAVLDHTCIMRVGHTLVSLCRLVRVILGEDAIAKNKLEQGNPLTVLGITIEINMAGVVFAPNNEKACNPFSLSNASRMAFCILCSVSLPLVGYAFG